MTTLNEQEEYKAGYRDGMAAAVIVAETCAADPTATAQSVLELLEVLRDSSVIQPTPNAFELYNRDRVLHPPEPPANT